MLRIRRLLALAVIVGVLGLGYWMLRLNGVPSTTGGVAKPDRGKTEEAFAPRFHVEVLGAGPTIINQDRLARLVFSETWKDWFKHHFCQPGLPIDLRVTLENPGERALPVQDPFWLTGFDRAQGGSFAWTSFGAPEPHGLIGLGASFGHSVYGNSNHPLLTEFGRRQSAPADDEEIAPGGARQWVLPLSRIYDLSRENLTIMTQHGIAPTFADAKRAKTGYVWTLTTASDPRLAADKEAAEAAERADPRSLKKRTHATYQRPEPLDASQTEIDDAGVAWGRAVADWRLGIGLDGELSEHLNGPVRLRILLKNTSQTAQGIAVGPPLTFERFRFHPHYYSHESVAPLTQHGNLELVQQQFDDVELEMVAAGAVLERRFFLSRHFDLSLYTNFDVQMVRLLPQPDGTMARLLSGVLNVERYVYRGPKGPMP